MSAKLLYSLSDEEQNLKKQIGCMNGLLQFLDPHHFINNRISSSPKLSQGKSFFTSFCKINVTKS